MRSISEGNIPHIKQADFILQCLSSPQGSEQNRKIQIMIDIGTFLVWRKLEKIKKMGIGRQMDIAAQLARVDDDDDDGPRKPKSDPLRYFKLFKWNKNDLHGTILIWWNTQKNFGTDNNPNVLTCGQRYFQGVQYDDLQAFIFKEVVYFHSMHPRERTSWFSRPSFWSVFLDYTAKSMFAGKEPFSTQESFRAYMADTVLVKLKNEASGPTTILSPVKSVEYLEGALGPLRISSILLKYRRSCKAQSRVVGFVHYEKVYIRNKLTQLGHKLYDKKDLNELKTIHPDQRKEYMESLPQIEFIDPSQLKFYIRNMSKWEQTEIMEDVSVMMSISQNETMVKTFDQHVNTPQSFILQLLEGSSGTRRVVGNLRKMSNIHEQSNMMQFYMEKNEEHRALVSKDACLPCIFDKKGGPLKFFKELMLLLNNEDIRVMYKAEVLKRVGLYTMTPNLARYQPYVSAGDHEILQRVQRLCGNVIELTSVLI